ncbi:hypothetical protein C7212DRAFT_363768 [Tuber magnatum]|uniref:Uncharacterized protein n=1 Tax=Tuber magnatum TaxID=42249 RepID=A0A317SR08_9PEZI|nr:hypothetical protein C7212DRAFT_363768 [Tuber magnatum]
MAHSKPIRSAPPFHHFPTIGSLRVHLRKVPAQHRTAPEAQVKTRPHPPKRLYRAANSAALPCTYDVVSHPENKARKWKGCWYTRESNLTLSYRKKPIEWEIHWTRTNLVWSDGIRPLLYFVADNNRHHHYTVRCIQPRYVFASRYAALLQYAVRFGASFGIYYTYHHRRAVCTLPDMLEQMLTASPEPG